MLAWNDTNYSLSIKEMVAIKFGESLMNLSSREIFEIVNLNVIIQIILVFGVISNAITITVFYKQGFTTAINISFTGLAISDLCSLLVTQWYIVCFNPLFIGSGIPIIPSEVQLLTAGIPLLCFTRTTGWITAYITAERCLSVYTPLTVKMLITPKRSAFIVAFIYTFTILTLVPEYLTIYIDWKFDQNKNSTVLGLLQTNNTQGLSGLTFLLYALYMLIAFVAVATLTITLVVKLTRKTRWRKFQSNADNSGGISSREKKSVAIAIAVAVVMIIFFTPSVCITVTSFIVTDFCIDGRFSNLFMVVYSFSLMFEVTNVSLCLVLYYAMSSKFRKTFKELMSACKCFYNQNCDGAFHYKPYAGKN